MKKRALITGIGGQDGSYLAELLLAKDYEVHGLVRRSSLPSTKRIDHIAHQLTLHQGDLLDFGSLIRLVREVRPHEVYNLAAQSFVAASFDEPIHTAEVTGLGPLRLLEAVRLSGIDTRFYQASSSEMFGAAPAPQSETTPFHPRSPYGVAKLFAHTAAVNYREAYAMHVSCGILFNHESERRSEHFVTRKIALAAARIKLGLQDKLELGNLSSKRDWGFAGDYVYAMWLMLQQDDPLDYVIATGETHTVGDFVEAAFDFAGLNWRNYVESIHALYRPAEVPILCGDASLARAKLGWTPTVCFPELVERMVRADGERLGRKENRG